MIKPAVYASTCGLVSLALPCGRLISVLGYRFAPLNTPRLSLLTLPMGGDVVFCRTKLRMCGDIELNPGPVGEDRDIFMACKCVVIFLQQIFLEGRLLLADAHFMSIRQVSTQSVRLLSPRLGQLTHTFSLINEVVFLLSPVVRASRFQFLLSLLHRAGVKLSACGRIIAPDRSFQFAFPELAFPATFPGSLPPILSRSHGALPFCCFCNSVVGEVDSHLPLCNPFLLFVLNCTSVECPFSLSQPPCGQCEKCLGDLRRCRCISQVCRLCGCEACDCKNLLLSWLGKTQLFFEIPFNFPPSQPQEINPWKQVICRGMRLDDRQAVEWLRSLVADGDVEWNPGPSPGITNTMDLDVHPVVRAMGRTPPCPLCSWASSQPNPSWEGLLAHLNDFHLTAG